MNSSCIGKGIITYIYLENFVTYDKVSVKPGRNLNLIIGPNGTGKSTIVCAIVLGLGGKPSTIGRAVHVADYVKAGCEQAKIEIHLKNDKKNDIIICRIFDIYGKSSWILNERPTNIKEIQNLTTSLDIQINNLCQFLPQDKVQDFSKMNAQELLENTERSVGDPEILERHKKLIEYRSDNKNLEMQIQNKKKLLKTKTQIYDGLKETVSRVKERKLIKRRITSLKQKKAWMLYDQKRRELLKLKKKKEQAAEEMISIDKQLKPIDESIEKIRSQMKQLANSVTDNNNKLSLKRSNLKKLMDDILECENNIKDCENKCKQRIQTEEARDSDIDVAQQQKSKLDNDLSLILNEMGSDDILIKQQQEIVHAIEKQRGVINMFTSKHFALKQEEDHINHKIRAQESELQLLNIETKRLQLLRERSSDTYKAVQWLRENRNRFSAAVYDPILLSLNVKNASYAKYLENIIPFRDLIAFVCENKQDMNLLLRYLRDEQKLQVNAVHSDPSRHVSMEPNIPLENIERFGFTHYLVSLIEAPSIIMKYLVAMYNLNNIPVGTDRVDDNMDRIQNIQRYFSRNTVYLVNRSKYTGEKSIGMQSISGSGMLSIVLDKSELSSVEGRLQALREEKNNVLNRKKQIEEQIQNHETELEKHKVRRNKCQQDLQQIQGLKSRISMLQKKIANLQNERISIDEIKASTTNDIKVILSRQLRIYQKYNSDLEECFKYTTRKTEVEIAMKLQTRTLRIEINNSEELREKYKIAESKVREVSAEMQPVKNELQRVYKEALETTNNVSPSDEAFAPINKIFNKLPPTLEEINKELHIAQAKVFCMGDNVEGENILQDYEQVKADIQELNEFIQRKTESLETTMKEIETLREQWLTPLSELVEKINSNFSTYFSEMGCAGEVILEPAENIMDFDRYGLKIKVKFRDTDQLQELTRHHQSGGERAVTTAVYMISLQELSRVPFRCVDEINQGMDAVNERRVFNLLVKMTGRPNSSQYFLLTPKLLPGLQYSETVTVHCVFNGPFMINHTEFDTNEYCKNMARIMEVEDDD